MSPLKRLFDLVASALGLLVLWPLFLGIGVLVRMEDGGPVFFRQQRVGYRGRNFNLLKFRTMTVDADRRGGKLTVKGDPRITRAGKWLRDLKLDELPQLVNVLRGEMSLVGPRPEVPQFVEKYSPAQRRVLELMPGITDPASIRYRNENDLLAETQDPETLYFEKIMPDKIRINREYAQQANVLTDVLIILKTLFNLGR